jgi:uncharacterized membrane protein YkgB/methionine-rich copper-binding protein CopC
VNFVVDRLANSWLTRKDFDYYLVRASMVVVFLFFGYQKWFEYEAKVLIPYISNGPLIFWLYPAFGIRGASWFLGVAEWLFGALLFLGFWNKRLGILGALGSIATFIGTVTIIPFMPNGWAVSAGGFPAMTGNVAFLMKDVVLLAVSIYLLKEDVVRVRHQVKPSASEDAIRSSRTIRRVGVMVAALMIGALPLGISRARTGSMDVVASYPKPNDVVDGSMFQISLRFDLPVDHKRSTLTLRSREGVLQLRPRLESAPNYLFSIAGPLAPGAYELVWEARLSGGQTRRGTIPFTVKSSQPSASDETPRAPRTTVFDVRWGPQLDPRFLDEADLSSIQSRSKIVCFIRCPLFETVVERCAGRWSGTGWTESNRHNHCAGTLKLTVA